MCTWLMMTFQDMVSLHMMYMVGFYDSIMIYLMMILFFIFYSFMWFFLNNYINLKIMHNQLVEVVWTMIPTLILMVIAIPSLKILYMVEEVTFPFLSVKILGHQWYWSYEYTDFFDVEYDSFILKDLDNSGFRLLDVDNRLVLPYWLGIRGLVSSMDVIHSWAMPSLGVKVDATPGRINQFFMMLDRPGLYYGQCSEICGLNHSFMPIVIESISLKNFFNWMIEG